MAELNSLCGDKVPYDQVSGKVQLSPTQHCIVYPSGENYREYVTPLDLAYALRKMSFQGPFYSSVAYAILAALKRTAIPHESMSMASECGTRLVRMLGCRVLCRVNKKEYRGVLAGIKPDERLPDDVVSLIITATERQTLHVRLDVGKLADGSAQCLVIDDGAFFDGEDYVEVATSGRSVFQTSPV
jgi:hypothetical protein